MSGESSLTADRRGTDLVRPHARRHRPVPRRSPVDGRRPRDVHPLDRADEALDLARQHGRHPLLEGGIGLATVAGRAGPTVPPDSDRSVILPQGMVPLILLMIRDVQSLLEISQSLHDGVL